MPTSPSPIQTYRAPFSTKFVNVIGLPAEGYFQYWPQITNLVGGNADTDLDGQTILLLPSDSIVIVRIETDGEVSGWLRTEDNSSPPTNLTEGIIQPTGYDPLSSPFVLIRQFEYTF
jgi:hypothetical protein